MTNPAANVPASENIRVRENQIFFALSIVIAIFCGLSAVLFTLAIEGVRYSLFGMSPSTLRLILVPTLVSLGTGFLLARFFPDVRGSGVPQTEAAYHLAGGVIPARVPLGKFITGVSASAPAIRWDAKGRPSRLAPALASVVGRWLRLSPRRVRDLVPVGAAGPWPRRSIRRSPPSCCPRGNHRRHERAAARFDRRRVGRRRSSSSARFSATNRCFTSRIYHLVHPAELLAYAALGDHRRHRLGALLQRPAGAAPGVPATAGVDARSSNPPSAAWPSG